MSPSSPSSFPAHCQDFEDENEEEDDEEKHRETRC